MKHKIRKPKLLILPMLATIASAEGGYYMGIGAGYSSIDDTVQAPLQFNNGATGSQTAGAPAGVIYLGYDFNQVVGIEANYQFSFNTEVNSYSTGQQLLGGSVLLHLPFGIMSQSLSGLSVFARGGLDYNVVSFGNVEPSCANCVYPPGSAAAYTLRYGVGAEYAFKNIGYRLEWDNAGSVMATNQGQNQVSSTSNSYLASILYRF